MKYAGTIYQEATGEWSWWLHEDGLLVTGGSGYDTEADAEASMRAAYKDRLSLDAPSHSRHTTYEHD